MYVRWCRKAIFYLPANIWWRVITLMYNPDDVVLHPFLVILLSIDGSFCIKALHVKTEEVRLQKWILKQGHPFIVLHC